MTTEEIISDEFMLFELEAVPSSCDETVKVVDVFLDDMDETSKSSMVAVRENYRDETIAKVKNFFLDLIGYEGENIEQFDRDSGVVLRIGALAERYREYFDKMKACANDGNYIDVCKLAMFTYRNFTSNYHYLESLRDSIKFATEGVTYYGSGEDTQGEFSDFFEEVFPVVKGSNKVYKK